MSGEGFLPSDARASAAAPVPRLRHDAAEGVGCALHDCLAKLGLVLVVETSGVRIARGDLAWADLVQRTMSFAAEAIHEQENP